MAGMPWIRAQMALLDAAAAVVSFASNWLLQSTLLIAAGLALGWLLRSRGAALQSAIYRTTLTAAIACPLATSLLAAGGVSGWSVEMPVAWTYEQAEEPADDATAAAGSAIPLQVSEPMADDEMPVTAAAFPADVAGDAMPFVPEPPRQAFSNGPLGTNTARQMTPSDAPTPVSSTISERAISQREAPAWVFDVRSFGLAAIGISLVWLALSAVLLLRLLRAWHRLHRLRSAAAPAEATAQQACRELAALLNVGMPELLRSPYVNSPCLAGLRRPAVLLPEADPSLPIHDVLMHELAHLRRRDAHWNLLRRLAEAAFFYQPLLWLLSRRLEAVAEEVCDDYVVHFGGNRERYARGLLEIAELSALPVGAAGVAMVSLRSILAKRIVRIMDSSRSLSTRAGNLLLAVVIAAGLAGTAVVGFVGLGSQRSLADAQASTEGAATADDRTSDATTKEGAEDDKAAIAAAQKSPAAAKEKANEPPGEAKSAPENQLEGIVTGANGKPIAGAKLYWIRSRIHDIDPQPPRLLATTDKDGRYRFVEPPPVPADVPASWEYMDRLLITAAGHGFKYTSSGELRAERNSPQGIVPALARALLGSRAGPASLPAAGKPIRGRLVDINGQPVAGAKVRMRWFADEKDQLGGLDEAKARGVKNPVWQGRIGYLLNVIEPVQLRDVLPSAVSDADGRFELRDIGAKRLVHLLVEGDGIEATEIVARNEPGEKIVLDINWIRSGKSLTVYPDEFVHAVGPSKPVTGRVLDLDSGEPIADAVVRTFQVQGEQVSSSREREHFAARTDAEGNYRIAGLPIGKGNALVAFATGDTAFIPVGHGADTSSPGAQFQLNFRLKRGVWAEGRVYDAETRKPFTGEISYYFFRDRKQEEAIPGLRRAFVDGLYWTNADGEFRVPVLPTRGVLAFRYDGFERERDGIDRFPRGFGAEEIAGSEDLGGMKVFPTEPHYLMPTNYQRIAEVPATDGQETVRVDMPLFASQPVAVRVIDPDGRPATQFRTYGANEHWGWQRQGGPQFEIKDLRPGERRKVFVFQRETNLGGGAYVEYGEKEVVEIKLLKAGSVRGRLLDADGEPIDDATLDVYYEKLHSNDDSGIWAPHPDLNSMPTSIPVDKQGRFRLDGLIPGWSYHARASAPRRSQGRTMSIGIGSVFTDVAVEPGEEKDLGDLTVGANKRKPKKTNAKMADGSQGKPSVGDKTPSPAALPAAEQAEAAEELLTLRGRVLQPDGKPAEGAGLYWLHLKSPQPETPDDIEYTKRATSDGEGRFEFSVSSSEFLPIASTLPLFALKTGFGLAWIEVARGEAPQDVTLRLVEDNPIRGRVTDTEGRPVATARVAVNSVLASSEGKVDDFLAVWKQSWNLAFTKLDQRLYAPLGSVIGAVTDSEGRFELSGVGVQRVASVEIAAPDFAAAELRVVNREGFEPAEYNQAALDSEPPMMRRPGRVPRLAGPDFDHVAESELTIRGAVFVGADRKTAEGITVMTSPRYGHSIWANTDAEGRYELRGLPRNQELLVGFRPPAAGNLLSRTFSIKSTRGEAAATLDVELKQGIVVEGRVFDRETGKGVKSGVRFVPLPGNAFVNQPGYDGYKRSRLMEQTGHDGKFRLMIIPGPGVLMAQADGGGPRIGGREITPYRQASFSEEERKKVLPTEDGDDRYFTGFDGSSETLTLQNAVKVIDAAPDSERLACDLSLDLGKRINIEIEDNDGQPVSEVFVAGLTEKWPITLRIAEATCTIYALGADRPRRVCLLHPERRLAAALTLTGDEQEPVPVRLAPAASISGRAIDDGGVPLGDAVVELNYLRESASELQRFVSIERPAIKTDAQGRFRLENIVPGERFALDFTQGDAYFRANLAEDQRQLKAGQELDLGDAKLKRLR